MCFFLGGLVVSADIYYSCLWLIFCSGGSDSIGSDKSSNSCSSSSDKSTFTMSDSTRNYVHHKCVYDPMEPRCTHQTIKHPRSGKV